MIFRFLKRFFNPVEELKKIVSKINSLEDQIKSLNQNDFPKETSKLISRLENGETLNDILPEAFALVRETAKRVLKQRHFDVQLLGGIILHRGGIAEMMTGEGKTLAATAPAYLNALSKKGVHVVTVNEYLAKRDTVWMGQIYHALGLKVSCLVHEGAFIYDPEYKISPENAEITDKKRDTTGSFLVEEDFLKPASRGEAYLADITYGTNHEFGFDYLRDNLAQDLRNQVQRPFFFAIVDEVDSILIDEARTPLIISAPDAESSELYKKFARIAENLESEKNYIVDEKMRSVSITESGIEKIERALSCDNIYAPENMRLVHYLEESLKAKSLFKKDKDYVVKDGEIIIVDEFTGRLMVGRRYSGGLHQAIEAKENVLVKEESRTYAKISLQNYFKMYPKLSGMTGTAETSAEEFDKVYGLEVISVPPDKVLIRKDLPDVIYKNFQAKMRAVAKRVKEANQKGQPVLIGTTSIEKNEIISRYLSREGIRYEMLNAKNNEREGSIIAQAGKLGGVTVATNMAGRGVDIILGGNPPDKEKMEKVKQAGGLLVIGTERHDARRIDNQLRGRSGRQGDQGESQFYLSLDDDLLRVFGGDKIKNIMNKFDFPEDEPISLGMVSKSVRQAQARIEGFNFDSRKHLLDYDDVLNKQRTSVYRFRSSLLEIEKTEEIEKKLSESLSKGLENVISSIRSRGEVSDENLKELKNFFLNSKITKEEEKLNEILKIGAGAEEISFSLEVFLTEEIKNGTKEIIKDPMLKFRLLSIFDMLWMNHLEDMEALAESVRLRAYGQHDPLIEYRREGHLLFENLFHNFHSWVFENIFRLSQTSREQKTQNNTGQFSPSSVSNQHISAFPKTGRNDPCPCGSRKKYKKCCGK
ncbi:MAG: preprotein translocase subunit SecA [Candidatus Liptonbacteria bacterium RIFOXYC1_FULL_36_8]|uniref:Protein translocase subunit SecA n=1 Tax=Candidatus Liptonbacteria bacterium RIFOXYC1_FULL_36_8 TaxID=1798655 RepID=A0A1G2CUD0_9BACT|nr:MAG: preprotein translocase subunit SecA [Candidatus Liptonbacteria bacterium RIFOXYC1_FULL_36_8]